MDSLTVKAISLMTGITAHTLRAWEKRYTAIQPCRTPSGRRFYTYDDVNKLRLLLQLTELGYSIGQIAQLGQSELEKLLARHHQERSLISKARPEQKKGKLLKNQGSNLSLNLQNKDCSKEIDEALYYIKNYDVHGLNRTLKEVELRTTPRDFILEFVSPLLQELGLCVQYGKIDISQEHLASALLKNHLTNLLFRIELESLHYQNSYTKDIKTQLKPILFATPEGQLHEFGILCSALLAAIYGLKVLYLGCNLPARALVKAANSIEAKTIVLGILPGGSSYGMAALNEYCFEVGQGLRTQTSLFFGGGGPELRSLLVRAKKHSKLSHDWKHATSLNSWAESLPSLPR